MSKDNSHHVAWSGTCRNCATTFVVYPHPFETSEDKIDQITNGPTDWDGFTDCFICGGAIDWNGSDPVSAVIR